MNTFSYTALFFYVLTTILSAIHFIAALGCHVFARHLPEKPMYLYNPLLSRIPWISGFILPVIPLSMILPIHWGIIFVINIGIVWLFAQTFTMMFLKRWRSSKGLGHDVFFALISGIVLFVIGLTIRCIWME